MIELSLKSEVVAGGTLDPRWKELFLRHPDRFLVGTDTWVTSQWDRFAEIQKSIAEGRTGAMPPMGDAIGGGENVRNVAHYVLSLSGSPHDNVAAQLGRGKFAACAACHGADGKGNPALGAPNLTDKVWLHGWGEDAIVAMINQGKNNEMPAHADRLSAPQIHVLAAYVWSLSSGKAGGTP